MKSNKRKKDKLLEELGNVCQRGGKTFPTEKIALEHIIPKCKGGRNNKENLSVVCQSCNSKKGKNISSTCSLKFLLENKDFFLKLCKYENRNLVFKKELTLKKLQEYEEKLKEDLEFIKFIIKEIEDNFNGGNNNER